MITTVLPGNNLQAFIDASSPGDTIRFTGVRYTLDKPLVLKGNRTYTGDPGAEIYGRFPEHLFRVTETNTKITNLTFDGAAIRIDSGATPIEGPVIDNCRLKVRNIAGSAHTGIIFEANSPIRNVKITNNTFDPIEGDAGIYGYEFDGLTISNNVFANGTGGAADGVHLSCHAGKSKNLLISQNYGKDLRRNFLELQGPVVNVTVEDNWYEWLGLISYQPSDGTFMYSLPLEGATGVLIQRNVALSPVSSAFPDKIGPRIVWEIGGTSIKFQYNYSRGGNHVIAGNGAGGTGLASHNNIGDFREGPRNANGNTTVYQDNGPLVVLPVDLTRRGRPGPNRSFGEATQSVPSPAPTPIPPPLPTPVPAPLPTPVPPKTIVKVTITYSDGSVESRP